MTLSIVDYHRLAIFEADAKVQMAGNPYWFLQWCETYEASLHRLLRSAGFDTPMDVDYLDIRT